MIHGNTIRTLAAPRDLPQRKKKERVAWGTPYHIEPIREACRLRGDGVGTTTDYAGAVHPDGVQPRAGAMPAHNTHKCLPALSTHRVSGGPVGQSVT